MGIQLDQITFDFDPERSAKEPLSFIRDATKSTETGTSFKSEDFVVTYARSDRAVPAIKIKLSCSDMNLSRAEIRGVPEKGNVLGDIPAMWVNFERGGRANEMTLSFPNSTLGKGVQRNTIGWEWQYRRNENEEWMPFGTTQHRVYCIFANPTNPWDRVQFSEEVCEIACNWAQGAQSEIPAATNITEAVFDLGQQGTVIYSDIAIYAGDFFNLQGFLSLLKNGIGMGQKLNCDDCATIVSTFGNILGCDLNQSEMQRSFSTNFVRLIGKRGFEQTGFERHAVAWKGACEANDPLYDACLQIDVDGFPNERDHEARQPANIRFGSGSAAENEYKFCMVLGSTPCDPKPLFMTRRRFGASFVAQRRNNDEPYLRNLRERYNFESFPDDERIGLITPRIPLQDFVKTHPAFDGWKVHHVDRFADRDLEVVDQIILLLPEKDPGQMAELNVYICAEATNPKEFFLQLLAQSNSMKIQRAESALTGAIVFSDPDQTTHFIKYHQLICLVRSIGKKPVSTTKMARAVEDYFVRVRSGEERLLSLPTSTAFITNDQLTIGELNMAHKLAQNFTCHVGGTISGLERAGHMDLSSMTDDGQLARGIYHSPTGDRILKGDAFGGNPVFFLVLKEFDDSNRLLATYNGQVVHEGADGKLVLAGKKRLPGGGGGGGLRPDDALAVQNETPWVITKP